MLMLGVDGEENADGEDNGKHEDNDDDIRGEDDNYSHSVIIIIIIIGWKVNNTTCSNNVNNKTNSTNTITSSQKTFHPFLIIPLLSMMNRAPEMKSVSRDTSPRTVNSHNVKWLMEA